MYRGRRKSACPLFFLIFYASARRGKLDIVYILIYYILIETCLHVPFYPYGISGSITS